MQIGLKRHDHTHCAVTLKAQLLLRLPKGDALQLQ